MSCRDEVLAAARELAALTSTGEFHVGDLVHHMQKKDSKYKESTIRTHVTSKMCANAPDHHGSVYDDFVRVGRGMYQLAKQPAKSRQPTLTTSQTKRPLLSDKGADNFQGSGPNSNTAVGQQFERIALDAMRNAGISVSMDFPVEVGVSNLTKTHRFDLGSAEPPTIIECKSHRWTKGNNVPSAKLTVWNEAMYYFACAPKQFKKILFVLKDTRANNGETLAQYYIRTYKHLIPDDVAIWEYDDNTESVNVVFETA